MLLRSSLKWIKDSGQFIVRKGKEENDELNFFTGDVHGDGNADVILCDALLHLFISGDLKFYAQILGHENMSGSWCMWCKLMPNQWKITTTEWRASGVPAEGEETWTIDKIKTTQVRMMEGELKKPSEICGMTIHCGIL